MHRTNEITLFLVDAGAVDYMAGGDRSLIGPIRAAFSSSPAELADQLAANPRAANHADLNGYTLLHHLAATNDMESVQVLLAALADPSAKTRHGETAIDRATGHGFEEMAEILRAAV